MKNIFIVVTLLVIAAVLRFHNYAVYPQRGATSDEYTFAFSGTSLLTRGVPVGWSAIPLYKDRTDLTIDGLYFPLVRPYLDHPPLFGILVGAWSLLAGETTFEAIRLATIRLIPILLSLVSSVFLYLFARNVYGERIARWSLAVYATATIIVVNSRVVVAESLFTLIWLAALWFAARLKKGAARRDLFILGALCAAAVLTKALGTVVLLSIIGIFLYRKTPLHRIVLLFGIAAFGAAAWILYGSFFDKELFRAIQSYQGTSRVLGPNTIWMMLGAPSIVNKIYYDGWYFWGLFALGAAALDVRKNVFIVFPAFLYLLLLMVSVNETDIHGWYLVPLFPFLAIAGGKALIDAIENSRLIFVVWAVLVGATLIQSLYAVPFGLTPSVYRWLIGIVLAGALLTLRSKRIGYGMAGTYIIGTAIATIQYVHPA